MFRLINWQLVWSFRDLQYLPDLRCQLPLPLLHHNLILLLLPILIISFVPRLLLLLLLNQQPVLSQ